MHVAITGVTGFIGAEVLRQALEQNWRVRCLYRNANQLQAFDGLKIDWYKGDLSDPGMWLGFLDGCDAVLHLASAGVADLNDAYTGITINTLALAHLMYAAKQVGVSKVVLTGSCFEYGLSGNTAGLKGLCENDRLLPVNAYAGAKAAGTMLAHSLSVSLGMQVIILRPFHVYGPGEQAYRLIPSVIEMAYNLKKIQTTDGLLWRDLVHVSDVAKAYLKAATLEWNGGKGAMIANVGTGIGTCLRNLIEIIVELCGRKKSDIEFGALPPRANEIQYFIASTVACKQQLNWEAEIGIEQGIEAIIKSKLDDFVMQRMSK